MSDSPSKPPAGSQPPAEPAAGDATHVTRPQTEESDATLISSGTPLLLPRIQDGLHPSELGKQLEGERLDHFQLMEFIGGGGMGAVFRAHDTMLDRIVAVKVLSGDQGHDAETQRRFKNEAQSAARLDHENIARVYYVGSDRGVHYIVFEFIEGVNIRDLVNRRGPLPVVDAISFSLQIAEALDHSSRRDVVHRDIKPSNVLITPQGKAKLVDMGLARLHQVEHTANDLTASGVTLGTFDYISPEQARDPRTADVRSDLYSLGCTLFFMLTGRPPFPEGTVLQKLLQHQGDRPPDVRQFRSDLPEHLCRVVARLLAKSPVDRYQEPRTLIADLARNAEELGLNLPPQAAVWVEAGTPPSAGWLRHIPWVAPLLLLLAGLFVLERVWGAREAPIELPPLKPAAATEPRVAAATGGDVGADARLAADGTTANGASAEEGDAPRGAVEGGAGGAPPERSGDGPPVVDPMPADGSSPEAPTDGTQLAAGDGPGIAAGEGAPPEPASTGADGADDGPTPPHDVAAGGTPAPTEGAIAAAGSPPGGDVGSSDPSETPRDADDPASRVASLTPGTGAEPPDAMAPLTVTPGGGDGTFDTLRDASTAAESGDVIELRFNGAVDARPILLANRRITIRAASGFRPALVFRPSPLVVDPVQYPRSMFTVTGGELTLIGVELVLDVPRAAAAESWSLLRLVGAQSLRLERCALTIRNATDDGAAYHQGVTFIDVQSPPGGKGMAKEGDETRTLPLDIRFEHCVARGEATLLRSGPLAEVHFSWENGLLAISDRLLEVQAAPLPMRGSAEQLHLELRHVTAAARRGLVRIETPPQGGALPKLRIKCHDSIVLADAEAALVEQIGPAVEKDDFTWNGDRNHYEALQTFWRISESPGGEPSELLDLPAWQLYWQARGDGAESSPRLGAVVWRGLPEERPTHAHVVADYELSDDETNSALRAAGDGTAVGFRSEPLPRPAAVEQETSAPAPDDDPLLEGLETEF